MKLITKITTILVAAAALAGCKESREEKIDRLFPVEARIKTATFFMYTANANSFPHISPDEAKAVVEKYYKKNSAVNTSITHKQYSEEYLTDEELDTVARMVNDLENSTEIAGSKEEVERISKKINEATKKFVTQDELNQYSKMGEDIINELVEMEAQAGS